MERRQNKGNKIIQSSFEFPLTEFEQITAKYFSEGEKPNKKHIALAIEKCTKWNLNRIKLGLKPYK